MLIKNKEHVLTDKQLRKIIRRLGNHFRPENLVICENRIDLLQYFITTHYLFTSLFDLSVWLGKTEGFYLKKYDAVVVFVYSQTDDGDDLHSHQLYSIHAFLHELYHRKTAFKQIQISDTQEEIEADLFATNFINEKSFFISKIMGWKDEWTMWEE